MSVGYILLSPTHAPCRVSRRRWLKSEPMLAKCTAAEWLRAMREAKEVDILMRRARMIQALRLVS